MLEWAWCFLRKLVRLLIYLRFLKNMDNLLLIWAFSLIVRSMLCSKIKLKKLRWSKEFYLFTFKTRRLCLWKIWLKRWNLLESALSINWGRARVIWLLFFHGSLHLLEACTNEGSWWNMDSLKFWERLMRKITSFIV